MEIHKLEPNIIAKIRSSATINSITQCVTELVLNSLDAKSTAVAVRINFVIFRIQVVDNGDGITKNNLKFIGQRYMTSKCNNLDQLESHCAYYGFRGEALASIFNISKLVQITSKLKNTSETWNTNLTKTTKNTVISDKDRPSYGTTVTIEGFLHNLPLRKKSVIPEVELTFIKRNIECLIIMHPNVSFSLRNDVTGDLILNSRKCGNIISSFKSLHPQLNSDYSLIKVSKNNVTVKGLLFKELCENTNIQYFYVNKRPVKCSKIQIFIHNLFQKHKNLAKEVFRLNPGLASEKNKHNVYVMNIKCPYSFVDVLLTSSKTIVEFKNWKIIFSCIEKLVLSFLGYREKTTREKRVSSLKTVKSDCGISQIHGVFKSHGVKRKISSENTKSPPRKIQKQGDSIVEPSQNLIESSNGTSTTNKIEDKPNIISLKNTNNISEFSHKRNSYINNDEIKHVPNFQMSPNDGNDTQKLVPPRRRISNKKMHPLPIKVCNKNLNSSLCIKSKPYKINNGIILNNMPDEKLIRNIHILPVPDEKSSLSKFTNDENKGKHLIMDMFLKSTQAYSSDDEYQDKNSGDTVFEEESKYFLENNITTNINGKSKSMSVSINITRMIKKKRNVTKKHHTTSKSIQTSLVRNKMIAKSIQTSMYEKHYNDTNNYSNNFENYTIILSKTNRKIPKFKFVHQSPCEVPYIETKVPIRENNCKCDCHLRIENIFNFSNYMYNKNDNCRAKYYPRENNHTDYRLNDDISSVNGRPFEVNENLYDNGNPYYHKQCLENSLINFGSKNINISSDIERKYELFNPEYQSTQRNQSSLKQLTKKNNTAHIKSQDFHKSNPIFSKFNESTLSNIIFSKHYITPDLIREPFKNFRCTGITPENNRTDKMLGKMKNCVVEKASNTNFHYKTKTTPDLEGELFITLSNRQKQEILQNELNTEKQFCNINLEWKSQMAISKENEEVKQNKLEEFGQEWIKRQNDFGSNFYVNTRTGFTTFYTPKPISNDFKLCKRFEFMPKGLSPILKDIKQINESLSQNKKDKLVTYILESHQNDLLTIKWQKYIKNNDTKTFFDEMYREKLNSFENCIPSASHSKNITGLNCPITFDKALFSRITVIGQVDKKFIAVLEETKHLIILFDQHAVHERIRLEDLLQGYSNAKVSFYRNKFAFSLSHNDLLLLKKHEKYLNFVGLNVEFFEDGINVVDIPLCLHNKFKDCDDFSSVYRVVQLLIKEIIDLIKETRGVTFKNLPKIILNILNLEACRGAIKFGDKLSNNDCEELLNKLSLCNLPFQCAHGRPTLVPLLTLNLTNTTVSKTLNLKNIYSR